MRIDVSSEPILAAQRAANHINQSLLQHEGSVLLLLSGGSSLDVIDYINEELITDTSVLMMADDRFSDDPDINNFMQFMATDLAKKAERCGAQLIDSTQRAETESPDALALAINKTLHYFYNQRPHYHTVALLGVGDDGHFASIFPRPSAAAFAQSYINNKLYMATTEVENSHPKRTTITPYFIKKYVNQILLFALSQNKCGGILDQIAANNCHEHEIPALIPARHPNSHLFTDCVNLTQS